MINGESVTEVQTLGSMYDQNSVRVVIDGKAYRLSCSEIAKMVCEFKFETEKKRIHTYLINPVLLD